MSSSWTVARYCRVHINWILWSSSLLSRQHLLKQSMVSRHTVRFRSARRYLPYFTWKEILHGLAAFRRVGLRNPITVGVILDSSKYSFHVDTTYLILVALVRDGGTCTWSRSCCHRTPWQIRERTCMHGKLRCRERSTRENHWDSIVAHDNKQYTTMAQLPCVDISNFVPSQNHNRWQVSSLRRHSKRSKQNLRIHKERSKKLPTFYPFLAALLW